MVREAGGVAPQRARPRVVIVPVVADGADLLERLGGIRAAGNVPLVGDRRLAQAHWSALAALVADADLPADAAWATLTSGTSGAPRIVVRTASSWERSFDVVASLLEAGGNDVVALPAPPASSLTLFSLAHALAGGPRPRLGATMASDVTCFHGTPQALRAVLDAGLPPRLRAALVGGSHLDAALRHRAEAAGLRVTAYYGAAELSFVALDRGEGLIAFPGVEVDVRDSVLWVRSPFVASGYVGAAGPLRRDHGWSSVGDRAELVDGRLRLLGRADDALLSASATIVPEEVEEALRRVPGVRDAIVFGIPRERVGALVAAFVELDDEAPADLRARTREQLAPSHRPRRWFAGELPRTASGKPARAEAVRRVLAGEVRRLVV
jgi:acyl-CoA synthetase (AMP-forming)/AMP-acid ligase II